MSSLSSSKSYVPTKWDRPHESSLYFARFKAISFVKEHILIIPNRLQSSFLCSHSFSLLVIRTQSFLHTTTYSDLLYTCQTIASGFLLFYLKLVLSSFLILPLIYLRSQHHLSYWHVVFSWPNTQNQKA